jgi:hypothetical protein
MLLSKKKNYKKNMLLFYYFLKFNIKLLSFIKFMFIKNGALKLKNYVVLSVYFYKNINFMRLKKYFKILSLIFKLINFIFEGICNYNIIPQILWSPFNNGNVPPVPPVPPVPINAV